MAVRIKVGDLKIGEQERNLINDILDSNRISEHKYVFNFEKEWAKFIGTKYSILLNSGTSALIAGLMALLYDKRFPKIKKEAKVITSPVTYIATSNAIRLAGLEPVYVDIHLDDFTLIPEKVEETIESFDKDDFGIILPVHLMGYPNDMDILSDISKKYDLVLFEDAAQSHGSLYKGKKTGMFSLLADYSFYIAHNVQVGEMGAIVTDDQDIWKWVKKIKANGRVCDCPVCTRDKGICPYEDKNPDTDYDPRFLHDILGYNFKVMEFQAAIGLVQLEKINEIIKKRQQNVKFLNKNLNKFSDILQLPKYSDDVSYLAYPIVIKRGKDRKITRKYLRQRLEEMGIETRPLFGCIPLHQPSYSYLKNEYEKKLPNAEYIGENGFYIGCHQYLSEDDLEYIVYSFENVLRGL
ncbi:MAG: DegT/DnrJ/EryC1/StrS family aminotransferase [Candidatus Odinarchaeia archaeon]